MRQITLAQALLWLVNAAIAMQLLFLMLAERTVPPLPSPEPTSVRGETRGMLETTALGTLPNPVTGSTCGIGTADEGIVFLGASSIANRPESEVAFLYLPRRGVHVNAHRDEPIPGCALTLKRLTPRGALFSDGGRDVELPLGGTPR